MNQGVPAKFVEELANLNDFQEATGKINPDRMLDREFITRFLAFRIKPVSEYKPDLDTYMNLKMGELKTLTETDRYEIKSSFISSMKLTKKIFGDWAFRKVFNLNERRRPINKALFEVWSAELSRLTEKEREILIIRGEVLFINFIELMNSDEIFVASITSATGDKTRVSYRYSKIEGIIKNTLNK